VVFTRHWLLAAAAALILAASAAGQNAIPNTKKGDHQRVTNLIPAVPPAVTSPKPDPNTPTTDPAPGEAKGVVLTATSWTCGRRFTDERGRTWALAFGPPLADKPPKVSGWLIRSLDGRLFFFTVTGSMYVPAAAVVGVHGAAMPALPLKAVEELQKKVQEALEKAKD
jgi:hypothetical protein